MIKLSYQQTSIITCVHGNSRSTKRHTPEDSLFVRQESLPDGSIVFLLIGILSGREPLDVDVPVIVVDVTMMLECSRHDISCSLRSILLPVVESVEVVLHDVDEPGRTEPWLLFRTPGSLYPEASSIHSRSIWFHPASGPETAHPIPDYQMV